MILFFEECSMCTTSDMARKTWTLFILIDRVCFQLPEPKKKTVEACLGKALPAYIVVISFDN